MQETKEKVLDTSILNQYQLFASDTHQTSTNIGWQLSPTPFKLTTKQVQKVKDIGSALAMFAKALDLLYRQSVKGTQPQWICEWLDKGKPESLIKFARMNRFKSALPRVIRPDLLITENGFALTEIDSVPGGIGFTAGLNDLYKRSGFQPIGCQNDMPQAFVESIQQETSDIENPVIAVVVSDEASDYLPEWTWLVNHLNNNGHQNIHVVHPKQLALMRDKLVFTLESEQGITEEIPIDIVYRFFELFDLPNIPNMDLIQFAIRKKWVACTPVFKPHLEEKMGLALFHHPVLKSYWKKELGEYYDVLLNVIPKTWVLDSSVVPPSAVIPDLYVSGQAIQSFEALKNLSQKERQLVIKPSGFSELAWGSRGVTIGHDNPQEEWNRRLERALNSFEQTPYILQMYHHPKRQTIQKMNSETGEISPFSARTRLCPYFFMMDDQPALAGVLATSCPDDKKIIHGMSDAVLSPVIEMA